MKLPECESLLVPVTQYAHRELPQTELQTVEAHLSQCVSCNDYVRSIREFDDEFQQILAKNKSRFAVPEGPHPEPSLIVALHADELSGEVAQQVSEHLVYCKSCRGEYRLLEELSVEEVQSDQEQAIDPAVAVGTKTSPEQAEELAEKVAATTNRVTDRVLGGTWNERLFDPEKLKEEAIKQKEFDAKLLRTFKRYAPKANDTEVKQLLPILHKIAKDLRYLPPTTISTEKLREIRQDLERTVLVVTGRDEPNLLSKLLIDELLEILTKSSFRPSADKTSTSKPEAWPGDKRNKSTWEH